MGSITAECINSMLSKLAAPEATLLASKVIELASWSKDEGEMRKYAGAFVKLVDKAQPDAQLRLSVEMLKLPLAVGFSERMLLRSVVKHSVVPHQSESDDLWKVVANLGNIDWINQPPVPPPGLLGKSLTD
jgi:hypothetical protein